MARMWRENDGMPSDVFTAYIEVVGHGISRGRVRARQISSNVVSYNFNTQIWRERGESVARKKGGVLHPSLRRFHLSKRFQFVLVTLGDIQSFNQIVCVSLIFRIQHPQDASQIIFCVIQKHGSITGIQPNCVHSEFFFQKILYELWYRIYSVFI